MVSSSSDRLGLLDGIRVLSFGTFVAGNICPLLLAELGADVVKIESTDRPEALRAYDFPGQPELFEPSGMRTSALFAGLTRSTRSVCLHMNTAQGRDTFRWLVAKADVVVENLGPGTMESWGCSFAELLGHNPRLVMLSMSGYGRTGPLANYRAYASNISNHLGLTAAWAPDGTHFDFVAGIHGASAVVAALASVDRGAQGVVIDMAQTEVGAAVMAPVYLDFLANGREWAAEPNEVPGSLFSGVVQCQGVDAWVAIEIEDLRDWATVCAFLDRDDLTANEEPVPLERRVVLGDAIAEWAKTLTPFQVAHKLQRVGLAVGPVQNGEDVWRDAQHRSRGSFVEVWHPDIGFIEYPNANDRLNRTPGRVMRRGSRLGEQTVVVLREWLELPDAAIAELERVGAVWQPGDTTPGLTDGSVKPTL
jgi:crotonobetainyl-CoA:carnitine CoA-transferase CaiB-like acyl-CoA transferase